MGNHNSSICRSPNGQVVANPDVAGIGILISFTASPVLVVVAVLYGYFRDSLPKNTLTRFDYYLLSHLPSGLGSKIDRLEKWIYDKLISKLRRLAPWIFGPDIGRVSPSPEKQEKVLKRRKESLERFVLSLGDQQLVTGLAVLIAGYSQRWSMSAYHFNILASLAWFSSATHLATLAVLKTYFREHLSMRNWRVLFMLVLSAMLVVAQIPGRADKDNSVPVICYYGNYDSTDVATVLAAGCFLSITYAEGILRLYARDIDWNLRDHLVELIVKLFFPGRSSQPSYLSTVQASKFPGNKSSECSVTTVRSERENGRFHRFESNLKNKRGPVRYLFAALFIYQELDFSFFVTMAFLLADLTYGFAQLFKYRATTPHGGIIGSQNEILSFGQLVPLFLLVLPIFAMGGIHSDDHATNNEPTEEALVSTDNHLGETSESEKVDGRDTNEQGPLANATTNGSPSATQASSVDATSLDRFLKSFGPVTIPLAESRSKSSITLDRIECALPKRVWTGNHSRGTQWVEVPTISSGQSPHRPSAPSLESADNPVSNYYPNIKYGYILGGIIACYISCENVVALAAAGVFSSGIDDDQNKYLPFILVFGVIFCGVNIGVGWRLKEIKRVRRTDSRSVPTS